ANDLYKKSQSIKVSQEGHNKLVVEYRIDQRTGKFANFDLIPENQAAHQGESSIFRTTSIDMSKPRQIAKYDKTGYKNFLPKLKHFLFGNKSTRMTRQRCEQFFDDSSNFV
ncbi:MAG: hypothetical protein ACQETL_19245, partial [Bacteroidota bacterium]